MEYKLEITKKLEDLAREGILDRSIAILNLPTLNLCEKRDERVELRERLAQSCRGCVTQTMELGRQLSLDEVKGIVDLFATEHGTRFVTINGRGDPFHPRLRGETLAKIVYSYQKYGIQAYIFTAGNNLDDEVCETLARYDSSVIVSLFGNQFIDANFFDGKEYPSVDPPLQNQANIAANIRRLIAVYRDSENQPGDGVTRIGMSYVISKKDLDEDCAKIKRLKQAANANRIFFNVNTNFILHPDLEVQRKLEEASTIYTDFRLKNTTTVEGYCQMGAGSSVTIDHDGTLLRCPYMTRDMGEGNLLTSPKEHITRTLQRFMTERIYPCVLRVHES